MAPIRNASVALILFNFSSPVSQRPLLVGGAKTRVSSLYERILALSKRLRMRLPASGTNLAILNPWAYLMKGLERHYRRREGAPRVPWSPPG